VRYLFLKLVQDFPGIRPLILCADCPQRRVLSLLDPQDGSPMNRLEEQIRILSEGIQEIKLMVVVNQQRV
jgi:hypothetical protein